jgi:hypothetical protein
MVRSRNLAFSISAALRTHRLLRYGVAGVLTLAILLALRALMPRLGVAAGYILLSPVVALSAWHLGLGPGILAVVLGGFGLALLRSQMLFRPAKSCSSFCSYLPLPP